MQDSAMDIGLVKEHSGYKYRYLYSMYLRGLDASLHVKFVI